MKRISVVIITQDEEVKTTKAILSCKEFANEIVVVDGGSSDRTVELSQELGCKVFINPWPGYAKQRNFGAEKADAEWIFMLDSDEVVDATLANSLCAWKKQGQDNKLAYRIKRIGNFFDTWLENTQDEPIRLYLKKEVKIKDVDVHEIPDVDEMSVGSISGIIWHYGFRSIYDHVQRFNRYTNLDAEKLFKEGRRYNLTRFFIRPVARFVQKYFVQKMCFKGIAGLSVAILWSYYEVMREMKLYELNFSENSEFSQQLPKDT